MKSRWIALALFLLAAPAHAEGPLDLGQTTSWLLGHVAKRGTVGVYRAWNSDVRGVVALNYGIVHNKLDLPGEKREDYMALAVGFETPLYARDENGQRLKAFHELDIHLSLPLNLKTLGAKALRLRPLEGRVSLIPLPESWELWLGPTVRIPTKGVALWNWRRDTGIYGSLGAKFGGGGNAG